MPEYSRYQKGIIRRYYDNKSDLMLQKLSELISDIALAEDEGKSRRLWARAEKALCNLKVPSARIAQILESQDPNLLAKVVEDFF